MVPIHSNRIPLVIEVRMAFCTAQGHRHKFGEPWYGSNQLYLEAGKCFSLLSFHQASPTLPQNQADRKGMLLSPGTDGRAHLSLQTCR